MLPKSGNGKASEKSMQNEYEYSDEDLEEMGEALLKAQEIQSDPKLFKMVKQYLDGKVTKIRSLEDLRKRAKQIEMQDNDMKEAYSGED